MKKTIEEVRDWLIENRSNNHGRIDLKGLDFESYSVNLSGMIAREIFQDCHKAEEISQSQHEANIIYQDFHKANIIYQDFHKAKKIYQSLHEAEAKEIKRDEEKRKDLT